MMLLFWCFMLIHFVTKIVKEMRRHERRSQSKRGPGYFVARAFKENGRARFSFFFFCDFIFIAFASIGDWTSRCDGERRLVVARLSQGGEQLRRTFLLSVRLQPFLQTQRKTHVKEKVDDVRHMCWAQLEKERERGPNRCALFRRHTF